MIEISKNLSYRVEIWHEYVKNAFREKVNNNY